jgi:predicted transcriptional regulator of viral defense system
MGLAGEPESHQAGACRDCEKMARSLTTHADEEQYYVSRRAEVVEAARRRNTITASWVAETWALSANAAHQLLSRAERAGLLTRVGFGEYKSP